MDQDQERVSDKESEDDLEQEDPRMGENWKIQKRKGFQKDRESKNKEKETKMSRTKKRNSNEPLVPQEEDAFDLL